MSNCPCSSDAVMHGMATAWGRMLGDNLFVACADSVLVKVEGGDSGEVPVAWRTGLPGILVRDSLVLLIEACING